MKIHGFIPQIEKDIESGFFIGIIPNCPGTHTQAETLEKLYYSLNEVVSLCIEELDSNISNRK